MATRQIVILSGNPTTGKLELGLHKHKLAHREDTILWQFNATSGVYSIEGIEPKIGSPEIWEVLPYPQGHNFKAVVSDSAPLNSPYNYTIYWKASENGRELKHDPIITIKSSGYSIPDSFVGDSIRWIIDAILLISGIGFFILWMMKRKEANKLRKELDDLKNLK